MPEIYRIGFTRVGDSERDRPYRCNIIFVHGLRGHPQRTWGDDVDDADDGRATASSAKTSSLRSLFRSKRKETNDAQPQRHPFWPHELLAPDAPDARIWTYGYNADVIAGVFRANNKNSVSQHGRDLAIKLERDVEEVRLDQSPYSHLRLTLQDPVIFVAHSLGGIIVKDAICRSESLQTRTQGIVFLGTPHRGSSAADWAQIASNLAAAVALQDSNTTITGALKVDSEVLGNIHEQFIKIATKQKIRLHSFQEARGMTGVKGFSGMVVGFFSSSLGLPDEQVETIDADHRQMVMCTGKDDARYQAISGVLRQFLRSGTKPRPAGPDSGMPLASPSRGQGQTGDVPAVELPIRTVAGPSTEEQPSDDSSFLVPFPENRRFVGRDDVLASLRDALFDDGGPQSMAIVGLGGVGKTQVALKLAYWVKENKTGWSVFWLPALSMAGFEQACTQVVEKLDISTSSQKDAKALVRSYLKSRRSGRWLLIVDNADDMDTMLGATGSSGIHHYVPGNTNGRILFTTRSRDVALAVADDDVLELEEMSSEEARAFSQKLLSKDLLVDDGAVTELLRTLVYLPLAISQAAAYIKRNRTPISGYLALLRDSDKEAISLMSREFPDRMRYSESRHAVATTWLVSFKQIQQTDPSAAELLSFMSQIEPRAIPETMLPRMGTTEAFVHAIGTLSGYAFIHRREDGETLDMHNLVRLAARVWVGQGDNAEEVRRSAVGHLATVFQSDDWDDRDRWRRYLPHVLRAIQGGDEGVEWNVDECRLGFWTGRCLRVEGRIVESVKLLEHVADLRRTTLPEDHPDRLASQHTLAMVYEDNGQTKEAVELLEHVVETESTILAEDHPSRLASQHALAGVYQANGQIKEALELLEQVAEVKRTTLAEDHPSRLVSQHELARAYAVNGQVEAAIVLLEHVVAVRSTLAESHPDRLSSQHTLAMVYEVNGQIKEAVELLEHVVEVRRTILPEDHPDRLVSQHELARAYAANGQVEAAFKLLEYVVEVQSTLAEDHPSRLGSQHELAKVYAANGQVEVAIELLEQVVKVESQIMSSSHPLRWASENVLARLKGVGSL